MINGNVVRSYVQFYSSIWQLFNFFHYVWFLGDCCAMSITVQAWKCTLDKKSHETQTLHVQLPFWTDYGAKECKSSKHDQINILNPIYSLFFNTFLSFL
jgi:hypothetical protein